MHSAFSACDGALLTLMKASHFLGDRGRGLSLSDLAPTSPTRSAHRSSPRLDRGPTTRPHRRAAAATALPRSPILSSDAAARAVIAAVRTGRTAPAARGAVGVARFSSAAPPLIVWREQQHSRAAATSSPPSSSSSPPAPARRAAAPASQRALDTDRRCVRALAPRARARHSRRRFEVSRDDVAHKDLVS